MNGLVHLQGIGDVPGKPAKDFKIGDTMVWNYGGESKVVAIVRETDKFIVFRTEYLKDGKPQYAERRLKKERLVATK